MGQRRANVCWYVSWTSIFPGKLTWNLKSYPFDAQAFGKVAAEHIAEYGEGANQKKYGVCLEVNLRPFLLVAF